MSERTDYQHPALEPFSRGTWHEVVGAWVAALAVVAVVLSLL